MYIPLSHQIGEVVAKLSCHEAVREAQVDHILHVRVKPGWVNQARQEVVSICWLTIGGGESLEDILTALPYACKLVLLCSLGIHLNNG